MQVIGRIEISKSKEDKWRSILINIGLISILIAILIELILGNYITLTLVVPLIYLCSIKKKIGKKVYKDVIIEFNSSDENIKLALLNSIYKSNKLCSRLFEFQRNNILYANYDEKSQCLYISFFGNEYIIFDEQLIEKSENKKIILSLLLEQSEFGKIQGLLK